MKKIVIITRPDNLEEIKKVMNKNNQFGMTVSMVSGCGIQKGRKQLYRGAELSINLLPKIKVEAVVSNEMTETLADELIKTLRTGEIGDGKIFISEVIEAIKIRTGERGRSALGEEEG